MAEHMSLAALHRLLADRVPIEAVAIDWEASGYTSEMFNRWVSRPDFPGWKGDLTSGKEAKVILSMLDARRGDDLLDVGCGYGRHSVLLAKQHGIRVTGVDISPALITTARRRASDRNGGVKFHVMDARRLAWRESFDYTIIALNTFSLFSQHDSGLVLAGLRRALRPGGRLFMDLDNRSHARRYGERTNDWYLSPDGLTLQETCFHQDISVEVTRDLIVTSETNQIEQFLYFMRLYSYEEICDLLKHYGFEVEQAYGWWDCSTLKENSSKILLVAAKN